MCPSFDQLPCEDSCEYDTENTDIKTNDPYHSDKSSVRMRRSRMTGNSQDKRDKGPKNLRQCSHPDIVRDRLLRSRLNRGQVISGGSMIAHSFSMVCEHLDRFVVGVSMVLPVDPHESWKRTEASLEASSASVERKSSQGFKGTRFDDFVLKFIPDGDQVPVPPRKEEEHDEYKDVYDDGVSTLAVERQIKASSTVKGS